jgi:O-antigen/teichoic acid export membrane protein
MQQENLRSKGIKAFIWDFFGKMVTQGTSFIVSIFLARLLDPSAFGLVAMVTVIIGVATVFTDVGLGSALVQRKKLLPVHYASVFYFNIFVGLLLTLATYFCAGWIGAFYNDGKLVALAQVMSLSFVINAFSSVQTTKLRKELNYVALTKSNAFASLMSGGIGVYLAYRDAGVWSLVAQSLSMGIFYNLLVWWLSQWKPSLLFSFKALSQLWGFGFRMFLIGLLEALFTRLDFLIIGKLFAPATLGFFQRAKTLNSMVIQYSSGSLMAVLFPILSKIQGDLPRFQNIAIKAMGVISFVVFMLLGGLYLISEELITFLFGVKWLPSVGYFQILALSGFGYPVGALLVNVLSSRGNSKAFLRLAMYKKTLMALNFVVLYTKGIDFYLYGLIVTSVFSAILNILFAAREIKLSFFKFAEPILDQAILSVLAAVTTLYLVTWVQMDALFLFIYKGVAFASLYFLMSVMFKTHSYGSFSEQVKHRF